jgi:hypothetical protein
MRASRGIFSAMLMCWATSVLAAEEKRELVLKPSSAWAMNYAEDSCHLARSFGEGKSKITVEFRQYGPSRTFALLVAGESLVHSGGRTPFTTSFEPLGARQEHPTALTGKLPDGRQLIQATAAFDPDDYERYDAGDPKGSRWQPEADDFEPIVPDRAREAKAERLRLTGPFRDVFVLEVGPMNAPMDAMRSCIDELLTHWGIDAEAHHSISRRAAPKGFPGSWLNPSDYPSSMIRQGRSAAVHFRLMVDENGAPTDCVVQTPTGTEFDKHTCNLLKKRAKFTPALNREGQPIRSYFVSSVTWLLPS